MMTTPMTAPLTLAEPPALPVIETLPAHQLAVHLQKWRIACAVAQAGSTTSAAEGLHLSQSAVARAIRSLEDALDTRLFQRGAHGMLPTAIGSILLDRAQRAFGQLAQADIALGNGRPADNVTLSDVVRPTRLTAATYRQFQTFIALHELGSEITVANALGISQPAVNQAIRKLEHLAGTRLFHRTTAGVRLNSAGALVLRRVKLALAEFRLAAEDVAEYHGMVRGRVVVGSLPLSTGGLVPRAVQAVLARYPELNITIVDGTYDTLLHDLRHADVDMIVGALRNPVPTLDVVQRSIFTDTLAVVARRGHPRLGDEPRELRHVADAEWILPLPGTPARDAFERAFRSKGLTPPAKGVQANSAAVVRALLLETDRLALLSRRQVEHELSAGLLVVLPITLDGTERVIGITSRLDDRPSAGVQAMLDALRSAGAD